MIGGLEQGFSAIHAGLPKTVGIIDQYYSVVHNHPDEQHATDDSKKIHFLPGYEMYPD